MPIIHRSHASITIHYHNVPICVTNHRWGTANRWIELPPGTFDSFHNTVNNELSLFVLCIKYTLCKSMRCNEWGGLPSTVTKPVLFECIITWHQRNFSCSFKEAAKLWLGFNKMPVSCISCVVNERLFCATADKSVIVWSAYVSGTKWIEKWHSNAVRKKMKSSKKATNFDDSYHRCDLVCIQF